LSVEQQAGNQRGKLESIKGITGNLPQVSTLLSQCRDTRSRLDETLSKLRFATREIASTREEAIRQAQKQEQYADLIKQREQERRVAEEIIDKKAEELRAKRKAEQERKVEPVSPVPLVSPTLPQVGQQTVSESGIIKLQPSRVGSLPSRFEGRGPHIPGQRSQQQGERPPYGARPDGRPNFGQRPAGNQGTGPRTWTPSQSHTAYGRTARPERPQGSFVPRPGFVPRPVGSGGFGHRPPGAGGFSPRPSGPLGGIKPTEKFPQKANTYDARKKGKSHEGERSGGGYDRRQLLRRGIIEERDIEERMLTRMFRNKKSKENSEKSGVKPVSNIIKITSNDITVKVLSEKIGKTGAEIIKQLMVLGEMCSINDVIDFATAELVAGEFGLVLELHADKSFEERMTDIHADSVDEKDFVQRPPVVTVMGHVDHGKTTLLDALRKTKVTATESGGITQHIGAYQVSVKGKKITFIDTPGHAAFNKMRARGAKITDIAILLVAADDGVMPQTIEAIKHIQKQEIPMIVAINKMDKKEANVDRVKQQLSEQNVIPVEWGGDVEMVPVSAANGTNLDTLLETIILVAEIGGYKANLNKEAAGTIIEAKLDKERGAVVTVLVQSGTLRVGDTLLAGTTYGKVRLMSDENGKALRKALPSTPVQVLGFSEVPRAGDAAYVVDEKLTKQVVAERRVKEKVSKTKQLSTSSAENAFDVMTDAEKTQLHVILKGDVAGSVEAIIQTINTITSDEVLVNVISSGVGAVNDNDVSLADVTGALLVAFHSKTTPTAKQLAKKQKVQIHEFKIIYEIFDFITNEMVKRFKPKFIDKYHGKAEVRAIFKSSQLGQIAGCMVIDGKIIRNTKIKLVRGDTTAEHQLHSLKIVKDDAKEVAKGHECGIRLEGNPQLQVGDILECYGVEQLPIMFNGRKYEF